MPALRPVEEEEMSRSQRAIAPLQQILFIWDLR